jgi:NADH:quinone reductase (non-electrogenic)
MSHVLISLRSGLLTALTQPDPEALRIAIRETRKLTSKPFGVNITLLPSIVPPDYEGFARVAVEEGVRIFETAGNNRGCFLNEPQTLAINLILFV